MCICMVYKIITRINPPCTCQKSIKLHDYTRQCLLLFQTESCSNKTCDIGGGGTNCIHLLYWPFEKCILWYLHMCTYMLGKGHLPWNYFYLWWPHAFHSHVCRSCAPIKSIKDRIGSLLHPVWNFPEDYAFFELWYLFFNTLLCHTYQPLDINIWISRAPLYQCLYLALRYGPYKR